MAIKDISSTYIQSKWTASRRQEEERGFDYEKRKNNIIMGRPFYDKKEGVQRMLLWGIFVQEQLDEI